jgi:hypothetical protein
VARLGRATPQRPKRSGFRFVAFNETNITRTNRAVPLGTRGVWITLIGGGGGGGVGWEEPVGTYSTGGGGGGGGGRINRTFIARALLGTTYSTAIGAAGAAGTAGVGGNGTASTFSSGSVSANAGGGQGGQTSATSAYAANAAGGTVSTSGFTPSSTENGGLGSGSSDGGTTTRSGAGGGRRVQRGDRRCSGHYGRRVRPARRQRHTRDQRRRRRWRWVGSRLCGRRRRHLRSRGRRRLIYHHRHHRHSRTERRRGRLGRSRIRAPRMGLTGRENDGDTSSNTPGGSRRHKGPRYVDRGAHRSSGHHRGQ